MRRMWARSALLVIGVLAVFALLPSEVQEAIASWLIAVRSSFFGSLFIISIVIVSVALVIGFYVAMLIECSSAKRLRWQPMWMLFLAFVPFASAFVYFSVTRKSKYFAKENLINEQ